MTVRVVLLAEGAGETGGDLTPPLAPGEVLAEGHRGPAHALVAQALARSWSIPVGAVLFEAPLRTVRGTVARGGELLDRGTLRRILSWARPTQRPDLVVVLIDADGELNRKARLNEFARDLPGARVIAVAVEEFEAWLLADEAALRAALDREIPAAPSPEELPPGAAKKKLNALCDGGNASSDRKPRRRQVRQTLCEQASLDALARACPSFKAFLEDLRAVPR
ncbi:MAG: DUF4276 family protein [Deltaproteobacteria bacterium]|nr:DUF4276 family protein [Deltaproteobacteria bacterium]